MSSAEIKTLINTKEDELSSLKQLKNLINSLASSIRNVGDSFLAAANAIEEAGTVGGNFFDNGKTREEAAKFYTSADSFDEIAISIQNEINALEQEIASLKVKLQEALNREYNQRRLWQEKKKKEVAENNDLHVRR